MPHQMTSARSGSPAPSSPSPSSSSGSPIPSRSESPVRWRFGEFELDPTASRLTRGGEPVPIQAQPFKLLTLLVAEAAAAPGRAVSRESIRDHLWWDTHVDYDQGINFAIRQVRQALEDDASCPRFIETVPGEGYRFVGDVEEGPRRPSEAGRGAKAGSRDQPRAFWRSAISGGVALLVAAVSLAALIVWQTEGGSTWGGWFPAPAADVPESTAETRPRILVLPFRHLEPGSGDPRLGELLAEEVITGLGRQLQGELDPLAFETVRRLGGPEFEIEDLNPDFLVEGSIRRGGSGLRINVRLTAVEGWSQLWATSYERSTAAELVELGRTIAEAVGLHFTGRSRRTVPRGPRVRDPEVFRLYHQARQKLDDHLFVYNRRAEAEVYAAHRLLEDALALDPSYPPLHVELARIHVWRRREGYGPATEPRLPGAGWDGLRIPDEGRARHHVQRALTLDEQSEAAHVLRGALALYRDLDLETAKSSLERALELNPSLACAHDLLSTVHTVSGRHEEALTPLYRAMDLSPLDFQLHGRSGYRLFIMRRFDEARQVLDRASELLPSPLVCLTCLRLSISMALADGDAVAAVDFAARELGRMAELGEEVPRLDAANPAESLRAYWEWRIESLPPEERVDRAALLTALGRSDRAFAALDRALHERADRKRLYIPWDPHFDRLRDDPRFETVVAELLAVMTPPGSEPIRLARR